jgi:hypothetical protein
MTTSFHSLSNPAFTYLPVQHCTENDENLADRISMDNYGLWEVIKVFKYLKTIQPIFYHFTQNLPENDIYW